MNWPLIIGALLFWLAAWALNVWLANRLPNARWVKFFVPALFGVTLLILWEGIARGANIPTVLLPPPSMIWERLTTSLDTLRADFIQTFLKSALSGYLMGCGAAS